MKPSRSSDDRVVKIRWLALCFWDHVVPLDVVGCCRGGVVEPLLFRLERERGFDATTDCGLLPTEGR
jgi:hypothetical protein